MSTLSAPARRIYQMHWNADASAAPAQSGVYLTRNARGQEWFRYFDARLGDWYMSWAEQQGRGAPGSARISDADMAAEVSAWARRTRTVRL